MTSAAIENLLGSPAAEPLLRKSPPGPAEGASRPTPPAPETQTLEGRVTKPRPKAASRPARLPGDPISYKEFIGAVQRAGAMDNAGEAQAATRATLGMLGGCLSWPQAQNLSAWLPQPLRRLVSSHSYESSMSRFAPQAFLDGVGEQDGIGPKRAAGHARAVLLALDQTLPKFIAEQLHSELASLWVPLTHVSSVPAANQARR